MPSWFDRWVYNVDYCGRNTFEAIDDSLLVELAIVGSNLKVG